MASGISVNGFAWPAIDVRPDSTETTAGVATSLEQRIGRGDHMGWDGGGWIVMIVLMVLFWAGVLAIAAWAIHSFSHRGQRVAAVPDAALDIARRRFANGEITQDEFEAIKRGLG